MALQQLLAFALFAFVSSITPGPNNTMVLASGANFGFRATIPHLAGIVIGFGVMIVAVGAGLGSLFAAVPVLQTILMYVGAAYLLYLAWRIATARGISTGRSRDRPMTFIEAALFQWVNPKGWMAALGAVATYAPTNAFFQALIVITLTFAIIMTPCISFWTAMGVSIRNLLSKPLYLRTFNIVMALLLVASLYPVLHRA